MASASSAACQATSMTHKIRQNWKKRQDKQRALSFDSGVRPALLPVLESPQAATNSNAAAICSENQAALPQGDSNTAKATTPINTNTNCNQPMEVLDTSSEQMEASSIPAPPRVPPPLPPPSILAGIAGVPLVPSRDLQSRDMHDLHTGSSITSQLVDMFWGSSGRRRHASGEMQPLSTAAAAAADIHATAEDIGFPRRRHCSDSNRFHLQQDGTASDNAVNF